MNRRDTGWRARIHGFLHPLDPEKREVLAARWDSLSPDLRTPAQVSGRQFTHCDFTTGASYCSFRCTHCYLPENANRIPLPSLDEMRDQIAANRRLLGPGGGFQITGGDVADAGLMVTQLRKNIDTIANDVADSDSRDIEQFISSSPWSHEALVEQIAREVDSILGDLDDTGFIFD